MLSIPTRATASLALVALLTAGIASASAAQSDAGSELHFFNWDEYVDPQVLEDFEAEFGIKVIVDTFSDENELVSVIQADTARFDLFTVSGATLFEMSEQRLVAELDHENIPNLANLEERYRTLPTDPGNKHGAAYDWGTTGITYNTDCIEPEEESWALLMDPRIAGRVAMDTDFTVALGSALKYLGYPLNSPDPAHIGEAIDVLKQLQQTQEMQFVVWDEMLDQLASGELCAGQTFNGDAAAYIDEGDNLAFFVPTEGSDFYVDVMAIPRDAQNKVGAEMFINYMLRPDVHAMNNEYTGYAVPNRASIEGGHVAAEVLEDPVRYPDVEGLETWRPFDTTHRDIWNRAWADFIISTT